MINTDGYYLSLLKKGKIDNRFSKPTYFINAYVFSENFKYRIYSKHEYIDYLNDFNENELTSDNCLKGKYEYKDDNFILLESSNKFENTVKLKILSNNKLLNIVTNKFLHFISWSDHRNYNNMRINNSKLILQDILEIEN